MQAKNSVLQSSSQRPEESLVQAAVQCWSPSMQLSEQSLAPEPDTGVPIKVEEMTNKVMMIKMAAVLFKAIDKYMNGRIDVDEWLIYNEWRLRRRDWEKFGGWLLNGGVKMWINACLMSVWRFLGLKCAGVEFMAIEKEASGLDAHAWIHRFFFFFSLK